MRIDSSLGNSQYQSRYIHGASSVEDVAVESATTPRSRSAGGNSTSTLLSASLANALWSLDSTKKTAGVKTGASAAIDEAKQHLRSSRSKRIIWNIWIRTRSSHASAWAARKKGVWRHTLFALSLGMEQLING